MAGDLRIARSAVDEGDLTIPLRGRAMKRAQEAINCLKRIPRDDAKWREAFQLVRNWLDANE